MNDPTHHDDRPLRILFITSEDPFYIGAFFNEFFRLLPSKPIAVIEIINLKPFNAPSVATLARRMLNFYGPIDFIRLGWRYVLARAKGAPMQRAARRAGVPVSEEPDINAESFLERLRSLNIDAVVSVAASQIFRKKLLELSRLGCWNVHGGRLPRFRGMMPAFWTLMAGESEGAVTVHKMNPRLDDGDILLQRLYPIQRGESLHDLIVRSKRMAAVTLLDALEILRTDNYELQPNDRSQATVFTFPTKEEVQKFRQKGLKLI